MPRAGNRARAGAFLGGILFCFSAFFLSSFSALFLRSVFYLRGMKKQLTSWYSPSLNKEMQIAAYGDYGFALLLVPTAAADYLEYERFQLMDHLAPFIDSGKVKIFSIDSINNESWMNNNMDPWQKSVRHQQWNDYVFNEVVPFIRN